MNMKLSFTQFDLGAVSTLGRTGSFHRGLHSGMLGADIQMLMDR
jgi:hypothetical protein